MADTHDDERRQRLSRIETQWSIVLDAHEARTLDASAARRDLVEKYSGCVYRYLLGAVRDPDAAEELSQEFVVRCLRGDFHRVSPERGRFRDYVKTVLINLVNDHHRARRKWPNQFASRGGDPADPLPADDGESFEACLRDDVLERTWAALEGVNRRYHALLVLRVSEPDLTSRELAERLTSENPESPVKPETIRKTLERARARFADLLVDQAEALLDCGSLDALERELRNVGLLGYCQTTIDRRRADE